MKHVRRILAAAFAFSKPSRSQAASSAPLLGSKGTPIDDRIITCVCNLCVQPVCATCVCKSGRGISAGNW